jgi:hypothetical protein
VVTVKKVVSDMTDGLKETDGATENTGSVLDLRSPAAPFISL